MRKHLIQMFLLLLVLPLPLMAQTDPDPAQTAAATSATCCGVRVTNVEFSRQYAAVVLEFVQSDGITRQTQLFKIDNGSPDLDSDNLLTGRGQAGTDTVNGTATAVTQPTGFLSKLGSFMADETGGVRNRYDKAIIRWLIANGKLPGVTVQ